ncbi:hypothetical protein [Leucobacter sp. L43]|uniref:hypothetical protein n=1 Tax=Leucobacter sp. L43 TaxID=2798040 RepID=UPI0019041088|nr:hypothetical protein [Leucobacter sp. L43]
MSGEIQAGALPPSVVDFYYFGYFEGRESRQHEIDEIRQTSHQGEIDRLTRLVDVYWAEAHLTKDQRRERILKRLDAGLQQADAATWDRIEAELYAALSDRQLNTKHLLVADNTSASGGTSRDSNVESGGERAA